MDADEYRAGNRAHWARAAPGWARGAGEVERFGLPVARWMIDAIRPQPGQTVLDLASGPGDLGLLAAELVAPGGRALLTDIEPGMLQTARARAAERGLSNVELREMDFEWLDLDTASVDAVLCRWGYMFALDVATALQEARRVLRAGGRVALAVWDVASANPWAAVPRQVLTEAGLVEPPDPSAPSMFGLGDRGLLRGLLEGAGFTEVELDVVEPELRFDGVGTLLDHSATLSPVVADAVGGLDPDARARLEHALAGALDRWTAPDGSLRLPGRSLVAAATA